MKKIVSVLLILAVLTGIAVFFSGCDKAPEDDGKKRAIIYVTALLSGGLYDTATGQPVWDPFIAPDVDLMDFLGEDMMVGVGKVLETDMNTISGLLTDITANDGKGTDNSLLKRITLDAEGNPLVPTIVPVPFFESNLRIKYGAINSYTESYNSLNAKYGDYYEVSVFNYDWRIDNRTNSARLGEFIESKGYDEIIFCTHSMGGEVISGWLAESQANRDKVQLFCSYTSPYYGSMMALTMLENPHGLVELITEMEAEGFLGTVLDSVKPLVDNLYDYQIYPLLTSLVSLYQLLPSEELVANTGVDGLESFIYLDGEPVTADNLYDFYCSRPWARDENGELRKHMAEWQEYRDSMYVTMDDGSKVHATKLVNTVYFAGDNVGTEICIYIEDSVFEPSLTRKAPEGDATVPFYSATCGLARSAENVRLVRDQEHVQFGAQFDLLLAEQTYAEIDKVLSDYVRYMLENSED